MIEEIDFQSNHPFCWIWRGQSGKLHGVMISTNTFLRRLTAELTTCLAVAMLAPASLRAASWDGDGALPPTGFWNDPMNWAGNLTPLFTDDALFAIDDIYTVKFTTAEQIDDINILDGDVYFNMPTGSLRVLGNLSIANASLSIPGLLKLGVPAANQVGVGGLIILDNGTLRVGSLDLGGSPALMPWLTNAVAGTFELNDSDLTIGTGGAIGTTFTASTGKHLRVIDTAGGTTTGTLTLGATGALHVTGGSVFTRSLDVSSGGAFSFTSGVITVDGGVFTPMLGMVDYETGSGTLGNPNGFAITSLPGSTNRPILTLLNGATSAAVGDAIVIGTLGGMGGIGVDGTGSLLQDSGFGTLDVGLGRSADGVFASDGILEIKAGGKVSSGFETRIAAYGGTAEVLVTGLGSELAPLSGGLTVGYSRFFDGVTNIGSTGVLEVKDGGLARGFFGTSIGSQGGTGTVTVDGIAVGGVSSTLSTIGSGSLSIGNGLYEDGGVNHGAGNGTLTVTNGGLASSGGFVRIGTFGGIGLVSIDGVGTGGVASKLSSAMGTSVGDFRYFSYLAEADLGAGKGTLNITNGGRADGGFDFRIGTTGGLGVATVDGIGAGGLRSTLETIGSLYVGEGRFTAMSMLGATVVNEAGDGTLDVTYGGLAKSAGETFIGYSGGTGTVTISSVGTGGVAAMLDVGTGLRVGYQQFDTPGDTVGILTLANGGQLASGTVATSDTYIGAAGGTGTVNIASLGQTSLWTHNGNVFVGTDGTTAGTGTLNVGFGGSIIVGDTITVAAGGSYNHFGGTTFTTSLDVSAAGTFQFTGGQITVSDGIFSPKLVSVPYDIGSAGLLLNAYAISGIVPGASSGPTLRLQNGGASTASGDTIVLGTLGGWGRVIVSDEDSKLRTDPLKGDILVGLGRTQSGSDASTGILTIDNGGLATASWDLRIGVQGGNGSSTVDGIGTNAKRSGLASGAQMVVGDNRFIDGPTSHAGTGSLTVTGGAFAASSTDFSIGYQGGLGTATVAGDGTGIKGADTFHYNSTLSSLANLYVGRERAVSGGVDFGAGDGALNVSNGGIATSTMVTYVGMLGGKGTLNVSGVRSDGTRSELSASAGYALGHGSVRTGGTTYRGTATVSISDGGRIDGGTTFVSGGPLLAHAMIGADGGLADVTVDGISAASTRSTLSAAAMAVGSGGFVEIHGGMTPPTWLPGTGNVAVTNGGWINSGTIYIGESGGLGTVTLDGGKKPDGGIYSATALSAVNLHIGSSRSGDFPGIAGNGSITMTNGGRADVSMAYVGKDGGIGSMTVDGVGAEDAPSEIDTTNTLSIGQGSFTSTGDFFPSQGLMTITNGGLADNHSETIVGSVGGIGAVNIVGVGALGIRSTMLTPLMRIGFSEFDFGGIRRAGEGSLTISSGGLANSTIAYVGDVGGDGSVTLDGISSGGVRSEFLAGSLLVGHGGVLGDADPLRSLGGFSVLAGARAASTGDITIGSSGGIGAANVSGIGTGGVTSELSAAGTLSIGHSTSILAYPEGPLVFRGEGTLGIDDGGLASAALVKIGTQGGVGNVTVAGVGIGGVASKLNSATDMFIGHTDIGLMTGLFGEGTLTLSAGGQATSTGNITVGLTGSQGLVAVSGIGTGDIRSSLVADGELLLGVGGVVGSTLESSVPGNGSLTIHAGGRAVAASIAIGVDGGSGSSLVHGVGTGGVASLLQSTTTLTIGSGGGLGDLIGEPAHFFPGNGSLTVADGGIAQSFGEFVIGTTGGHGEVSVTGIGAGGARSTLAASTNLLIGDLLFVQDDVNFGSGNGSLHIADGGDVSSDIASIGFNGGTGDLHVDGVSSGGIRSEFTSGDLYVGSGRIFVPSVPGLPDLVLHRGVGTMNVSGGGLVSSALVGVGVIGGHGTMTLTGQSAAGVSSMLDAASLSVGVGGRFGAGEITGSVGSLSVLAGAHAVSAGIMGIGTSGGSGSAEIVGISGDGTQSRLSATRLAVGSSRAMDGATELAYGDGSLHVADGGQVVLTESLALGQDGGHGTLVAEGVGTGAVSSMIDVSNGFFGVGYGGSDFSVDHTRGLGQGNASILSGATVLAGAVFIGTFGGSGTVLVDGVDAGGARSSLLGNEFSPISGTAFWIGTSAMYTNAYAGGNVVGISEGSLTVSNGGLARAGTFLGVPVGAQGGHGNLVVDGVSSGGEASRFDISCRLQLGHGTAQGTLDPLPFRSEGVAAVTNGGQLTSGSDLPAEAEIGGMGGIGILTVSSSTANVSSWVQTGNAHLGASSSNPTTLGTGTLNIGTGGMVDISDTLHVYHSTSVVLGESGGLVNLDGGTLKLAALDLQGESAGLDWTSGTLWLNGGTSDIGAMTVPTSGTLKGIGTVLGDIVNTGTVTIGASPGLLESTSFTQTASGVFDVEITGNPSEPGLWDRLITTGNLVVDGILNITFANTLVTSLNDTWTFLTSTGGIRSGMFSDVNIVAPDALAAEDFTVDYGADYVRVRRSGAGMTYDIWKLDFSWPGDAATTDNPDQDPDHDGNTNQLEYAFGTDPLASDILPITTTVTNHAGDDYLTLIFTRPGGANLRTDLAYRVVRSTDLTPATSTDLVSDLPSAGDPATVVTRSSSIYRSVDREFLQSAVHFTIPPAP